jgi:hypothetical protein
MTDSPVVRCSLCGTPCRTNAVECDVCERPLDAANDLEGLREEVRVHRQRAILGLAGTLGLVALSVGLSSTSGGGRWFAFFVVPGAMSVSSWIRWRAASRRIRALESRRPSAF